MSPDPFAWDLIDHVTSLYGSCRTYQDTGEVTWVFDDPPSGRRTKKSRFRTAFVRPDRFFFKSRHVAEGPEAEWRRDVIWIDTSGVRSWTHLGFRLAEHKSVVEAAAALSGASQGASAFIPWLLRIGDRSPCPLPNPLSAKTVGTAELDGRACDRIEGEKGGERSIVWIERGTRLVLKLEVSHVFDKAHFDARAEGARKVLESMKPDDSGRASLERMLEAMVDHRSETMRIEKTTVWDPMMDRPVDPAVFELTPPASNGPR